MKAATKRAAKALRAASRQSGKTMRRCSPACGKGEISEKQFSSFVKGLPKQDGLDAEQAVFVFEGFGKHGLRKPGFAKMPKELYVCEKATGDDEVVGIWATEAAGSSSSCISGSSRSSSSGSQK